MWQALLSFIFDVIENMATVILYPLYQVLLVVVPNFDTFISSLLQILDLAVTGAIFFIKVFCIPVEAFSMFFVFIVAYTTFQLAMKIIKLVYNLYHKLKPT